MINGRDWWLVSKARKRESGALRRCGDLLECIYERDLGEGGCILKAYLLQGGELFDGTLFAR